MTKIKFCGLFRPYDVEAANELKPDYIGFVFAKKSRRHVTPEKAGELKRLLIPGICTVGVFVDEMPQNIAKLLNGGIIDIAQLHGEEGEDFIHQLRQLSSKPILQAFCIRTAKDVIRAGESSADYVLLDSGAGTGEAFDWRLMQNMKRPYFLAGGLEPANVGSAIRAFHPFAVDVSSGIETDGRKDKAKMAAFAAAVRKETKL